MIFHKRLTEYMNDLPYPNDIPQEVDRIHE
jgi:hypothetical protein